MCKFLYRICLGFLSVLIVFSVCYGEEGSRPGKADQSDYFAEGFSEDSKSSDDRINELMDRLERLEVDYEKLHQEREIERLLTQTSDEKEAEEEDILSAAEGNYTLQRRGTMEFEYGGSYSYGTSLDNNNSAMKNHSISSTLSFSFGVLDNLTCNANIPFIYKYYQVGVEDARDVTDLGDASFGIQVQPFKMKTGGPSTIFSFNITTPSGRSRYKIDPDLDLSTGSGYYSVRSGINLSKALDPVMVFGGVSFTYAFPIKDLEYKPDSTVEYYATEVDPPHSASLSLGMGYSISYNVNLSLSVAVQHIMKANLVLKNDLDKGDPGAPTFSSPSPAYSAASINLGSNFRISPKQSISVSISHGLTVESPDFAISFRVPFTYDLAGG